MTKNVPIVTEGNHSRRATCNDCRYGPGKALTGYCKHPDNKRLKTNLKKSVDAEDKACDDYKSNKLSVVEKPKEVIDPKITEEAQNILTKGDPLNYLMDTYQELHVGDIITGKVLLISIGCQSIENTAGIQPKLSGESGKGKTHAAKSIGHMTPREYIIESSLSGKVLFYDTSIKAGTIVFSDDVNLSEDMQGVIKRATTNFQNVTQHRTLDKDRNPITFNIPPRINWWLTSVSDDNSMELLNRQVNINVDESKEQDEKVYQKLIEKAMTGEAPFPITHNVLVCREIIRDIKGQLFKVSIPFADRIDFDDRNNRRAFEVFCDYIRAIAVFNYKNRKIDNGHLDATEEDFQEALTLYDARKANQKFKLNDSEINLLSKMKPNKEYDMNQLMALIGKSRSRTYEIIHGKKKTSSGGSGGLLSKFEYLTVSSVSESLKEELDDDSPVKRSLRRKIYVLTVDFNALIGLKPIATLRN